jgi:hypothetical protein
MKFQGMNKNIDKFFDRMMHTWLVANEILISIW